MKVNFGEGFEFDLFSNEEVREIENWQKRPTALFIHGKLRGNITGFKKGLLL
jgi:hypothetical protein